MIIHCCINPNEKIKTESWEKVYKVEFEYRGYWSKRYAAINAKEAKEKLFSEYPEATYKRSKASK